MFKIEWGRISDPYAKTFIIVPDAHALFEVYHILEGYGRQDGSIPVSIKVTNLDGHLVDMSHGLAHASSQGTYSSNL